jgi:pilus assembly protein Flp/PilA
MINALNRLVKDESGATAVEYGLMAALIGVALTAGATSLGKGLNTQFKTVADKVNGSRP